MKITITPLANQQMWNEFKTFLIKQNVLALAIAVVVGVALNALVKALVDDFIMPIVGAATPSANWKAIVWHVGPIAFGVGDFASALLNFIIIGLVAWRISKAFIKPEAAPSTKQCPFCKMTVDSAATRCSFCTSAL